MAAIQPQVARVEISPRQYSIRVYAENEPEKYDIASCQIFVYGDRGFMFSLHGPGFYKHIPQILEQVGKFGLRTLEGYVGKGHARLLHIQRRVLSECGWSVELGEEGVLDGHPLVWITVQRIRDNDERSNGVSYL